MGKRKLGRGLDILISPRRETEEAGGASERQPGGASEGKVRRRKARRGSRSPRENGGRKARAADRGSEPRAPEPAPPAEDPGSTVAADGASPSSGEETNEGGAVEVRAIPPARIVENPDQPRKRFALEELEALKTSVARDGILQPVLVRSRGDGFQLIAGERRLRAAREVGLPTVPAIVVDVADERLLELALVENIHRANLNPIELAEAYRQLMERTGWTQEELAERIGVSRPKVSNTTRLLELPVDMQEALVRGQVTAGHAKVLLSVEDETERRALFERIAEENLTVRDLEVERPRPTDGEQEPEGSGRRRKRAGAGAKKPYIVSLEEELSEAVGTRVRIREKGGRGALTIDFYSQEDFERIRRRLGGRADN